MKRRSQAECERSCADRAGSVPGHDWLGVKPATVGVSLAMLGVWLATSRVRPWLAFLACFWRIRVYGAAKTLKLTLESGHYVLICNVGRHYLKGMRKDFTVA